MQNDLCISTWIHIDNADDESYYPQVGARSSSLSFQKVYWRCIVTFFATSIRNNPNARHVLFTNAAHIPTIDGFDVAAFLSKLKVEVVTLQPEYFPPKEYYGSWRNQFFIFDIIQHVHSIAAPDERWIVLDSDCVWLENGGAIAEAIDRYELLTYALIYPFDWKINGLTRYDMQALYFEISNRPHHFPPIYCGGEIYAATGAATKKIARDLKPLWESMLDRFAQGKKYFTEEAHALSYLYHQSGYPIGTANGYIKRIWTGLPTRFNTALPTDFGLIIWHLPIEKKYGLRRLFEAVRKPDSLFWTTPTGPSFSTYLGTYMGIPKRSASKLGRDSSSWLFHKARQLLPDD